VASKFRDGRSEYDNLIRLQESDRRATTDLERLAVTAAGGRQVPLRNLTSTPLGRGPVGIERRDQERVLRVQAGMTERRDFDSIATDIEQLLAAIDIPAGFRVAMGGERQEQRESHRNVMLTIVRVVLLVYMTMAALFESLVHPVVILCTIPFAVVGGIVTLWATGTNLSMPVYIGAIMLVGIAVNNGIVMVDYTNQLRQQGRDVLAATLEGSGDTQVGLAHQLVGAQALSRIAEHHLAALQHVAAGGDLQGHAGVLLDQQDGDPGGVQLGDSGENALHQDGCQSHGGFVQQQEAGIGHQSAANRQHLLFPPT
jgi:hypothetical protein